MAKFVLIAVVICLAATLAIGFFTGPAHAQDYMDRKGIEGLFAGKKDTEGKGPTTTQKIIGIGSIFVMIAVVKWL